MKRTKELKQEYEENNGLTQDELNDYEQEYLRNKVECYSCGEMVEFSSCDIELIADNVPEQNLEVAICKDCIPKKIKLFNNYEE